MKANSKSDSLNADNAHVAGAASTDGIDFKLESILKINDDVTADGCNKNSKGVGQAPDTALRAAILNQYQDVSSFY